MSPRSAGPPDPPVRIFVDRNLSSGILLRELREARITKDLGLEIRDHVTEFPENDNIGVDALIFGMDALIFVGATGRSPLHI